jgi:ABC-type phosphate transport system permease subunit
MVWLTGAALALCGLMVVALLAVVVAGGVRAFWPRDIELVRSSGGVSGEGAVFLGSLVRTESYQPSVEERAAIDALAAAGRLAPGALDDEGLPVRRLYRTGNKEFRSQPFVWVPVWQISSSQLEPSATQLERTEWGVWHGYPKGVVRERVVAVAGPREAVRLSEGKAGDAERVERVVRRELEGGRVEVLERTIYGASPEAAMAKFREQHAVAVARRGEIERLKSGAVGDVNAKIEAERLRVRKAELLLERQVSGADGGLLGGGLAGWRGPVAVVAGLAALVCGVLGVRRLTRRKAVEVGFLPPPDPRGTLVGVSLVALGVVLGLLAWVEHPFGTGRMTAQGLAEVREASAVRVAELQGEYERIMGEVGAIDAEDAQWRVLFVEPSTGRFAPVRQTEPDSALRISQVIRAVQPNELGWWAKLGVYLDRWGEFLFDVPREANTEGGVFPVIFGTVTLTLLLSVVVVPLGVIAALYLREYAKQGPLTSALRIAINNLAGVPSIVYGVFGLGFFCYTVGQYVDTGSGVLANAPASMLGFDLPMRAVALWWLGVLSLAVLVVGAVVVGGWASPLPGKRATATQEGLAKLAFGGWCVAALGALALVAYTPYFRGFFEAQGPAPTFATKGMLWSACTLALLTLPVVIVATEEAIAAVPRSMREGSYGCGASKWQTIQRIVLPRAMPGIMTGMILAMARGAGEVAPLMLVGAVKLAPSLPLDGQAPFVHLDRPFMHLGFHIYDVGFQSPDAEAARPVVWCTTFLLIVVVVALNITAIRVRAGLRKKFMGEAF